MLRVILTSMKERHLKILVLLVVGIAVVHGIYTYVNIQWAPKPTEITADINTEPLYDDPFLMGQYHFNSDPNFTDGDQYDLQKARQYYTEAVIIDSEKDYWAWYQLGRIDFIEGKFLSALYKFDKYNEYAPESGPSSDYMVGLVYGYMAKESKDQAHWDLSAEHFSRFVELVPTEWAPRVDLTWVYFAQGKYKAMLPILEEGLEYNPTNPWLNNMYGLALLNTDNKAEAHIHFLRAQESAENMTVSDWSEAYPGNDPLIWGTGLAEFRDIIAQNVTLSSTK